MLKAWSGSTAAVQVMRSPAGVVHASCIHTSVLVGFSVPMSLASTDLHRFGFFGERSITIPGLKWCFKSWWIQKLHLLQPVWVSELLDLPREAPIPDAHQPNKSVRVHFMRPRLADDEDLRIGLTGSGVNKKLRFFKGSPAWRVSIRISLMCKVHPASLCSRRSCFDERNSFQQANEQCNKFPRMYDHLQSFTDISRWYAYWPIEHRDFSRCQVSMHCGHFFSSVARRSPKQEVVALWLKKKRQNTGAMASIGSSSLGELYSKCVQMVPWMRFGLDRPMLEWKHPLIRSVHKDRETADWECEHMWARCSLRSMRTKSQQKTPSNCHSLSTWMTSWIPSWVAKRQWLLWGHNAVRQANKSCWE